MKKSTQIAAALIATSMSLAAGTGKAITYTEHVIESDMSNEHHMAPTETAEQRTVMQSEPRGLIEKALTEAEKRQMAMESIRDGQNENTTIHRLSVLNAHDEKSRQLLEDVRRDDNATPQAKLTALATLGTLAHYEVEAFEALRKAAPESARVEWDMWKILYANAIRDPAENALKTSEIEALLRDETLDPAIRALGAWGIRDEETLTNHVKEGCLAGADTPEQGVERFNQTPRQCGVWTLKANADPERLQKILLGEHAGHVLKTLR